LGGDGVGLAHRGLDVVHDTTEPDGLPVEEHVRRPPVPVPRVADRTDVADHPLATHPKPAHAFLRSDKLPPPGPPLHEHPWDTGIAGETDAVEVGPQFDQLLLVGDVLRDNVATKMDSWRAVDVQHVALPAARRQPGKEPDAALTNGGVLDRGSE